MEAFFTGEIGGTLSFSPVNNSENIITIIRNIYFSTKFVPYLFESFYGRTVVVTRRWGWGTLPRPPPCQRSGQSRLGLRVYVAWSSRCLRASCCQIVSLPLAFGLGA